MKSYLILALIILTTATASASSYLTIYLQENGDAVFIGNSEEQLILPEGISTTNGVISGRTNVLTNKQGSVWEFSFSQENSEMTLFLPKNAVLKSNSIGDISIKNSQISIQTQNTLSISYELNGSSSSKVGWIILIILVIIIFFIILKNKNKKQPLIKKSSRKKNDDQLINNFLNDREKIILKKLKETGKIKQARLGKLTGIPKASFSRHIQELEKKHLLKRIGDGKNKLLESIN